MTLILVFKLSFMSSVLNVFNFMNEFLHPENNSDPDDIVIDDFEEFIRKFLSELPDRERALWKDILGLCETYGKKKITKKMKQEFLHYKNQIPEWSFEKILEIFSEKIISVEPFNIQKDWYVDTTFFSEKNQLIVKSIIFLLGVFRQLNFLLLLEKMARKFYKKIPNKWPGSALLGNACIESITFGYGIEWIGTLFALSEEVRHPSSKKTILKSIEKIGSETGLSREELEDRTQKDFHIINRTLSYQLDKESTSINLSPLLKIEITYISQDQKIQKTPTKNMQDNFAEKIIEIKNKKKEIEQFLKYQKKRFESFLVSEREFQFGYFSLYFLENSSIQMLLEGMIFLLDQWWTSIQVLYVGNNQFISRDHKIVSPTSSDSISFIHPIHFSEREKDEWKEQIQALQKTQFIKQLDREIFDHSALEEFDKISWQTLQQYQVVELAVYRWWKASLQWDFDSGNTRYIKIYPAYNIECWVDTDIDRTSISESGIAYYIILTSISWHRCDNENIENLSPGDLPEQVISESLRDIHLFHFVGKRDPEKSIKDFLESL